MLSGHALQLFNRASRHPIISNEAPLVRVIMIAVVIGVSVEGNFTAYNIVNTLFEQMEQVECNC